MHHNRLGYLGSREPKVNKKLTNLANNLLWIQINETKKILELFEINISMKLKIDTKCSLSWKILITETSDEAIAI